MTKTAPTTTVDRARPNAPLSDIFRGLAADFADLHDDQPVVLQLRLVNCYFYATIPPPSQAPTPEYERYPFTASREMYSCKFYLYLRPRAKPADDMMRSIAAVQYWGEYNKDRMRKERFCIECVFPAARWAKGLKGNQLASALNGRYLPETDARVGQTRWVWCLSYLHFKTGKLVGDRSELEWCSGRSKEWCREGACILNCKVRKRKAQDELYKHGRWFELLGPWVCLLARTTITVLFIDARGRVRRPSDMEN